MRPSRRTVLVVLGVAIGVAFALPIAAQSTKQIKQARKLLDKLKLVDGPGSGLDAETVQGLTPAQVAAAITPPTPQDTLAAIEQVDGPGSGLDADTLRGLSPLQLMGSGGSGGGLVVVDANDTVVGSLIQFYSGEDGPRFDFAYAARRVDGQLVALRVLADGFPESFPEFWYESADCSGAPLAAENPEFPSSRFLLPQVTVHDGTGFYVNGPVATRTVSSLGFTIAPDVANPGSFCTTICTGRLNGASANFTPPGDCCCSAGGSLPQSRPTVAYASFPLSSLGVTPPFRVDAP